MLFQFFWNIIFFILFLCVIPISFFNGKIRKGIWGRFGNLSKLRQWRETHPGPVISIHTASYGEFEHIRPFIHQLKKHFKGHIVILFFSPSGYEYLKNDPLVDGVFYTPFEFYQSSRRFFKFLNPSCHFVAKHDVWPTEIFVLHQFGVPVILLNASLSASSRRIKYLNKFHRIIYQKFFRIYAIDEADAERYMQYLGINSDKILIAGDTKNDQVLYRQEKALSRPIFPRLEKNRKVFVAGSIWPEDWAVLRKPVEKLLKKYPDFSVILCPHELDNEFIQSLLKDLSEFDSLVIDNNFDVNTLTDLPGVLIIDRMGILADVYALGDFALVGGSFKGKVHNVLEPAVYGIPVITGPYIDNSTEALRLKEKQGLFVVQNKKELEKMLTKMLTDETFRQQHGIYARQFVLERVNTVSAIIDDLIRQGILSEGL